MDLNDFAREVRRKRDRIVADADRMQAIYDKVLRDGHGRSVAEVRDLLAREWRQAFGDDMAEPKLSQYAESLAHGDRINVNVR